MVIKRAEQTAQRNQERCVVLSDSRKQELDRKCAEWRRAESVTLRGPRGALDEQSEFKRTLRSMRGLAAMLHALQQHVHANRDLYEGREKEIGTIVNALIRNWPVGSLGDRLRSEETNLVERRQILGEHDVPISFFRDILREAEPLSVTDWHYLVARFLRVRWITDDKNDALGDNGFKQNRPEDAYRQVGITMTAESNRIESLFDNLVSQFFTEAATDGANQ